MATLWWLREPQDTARGSQHTVRHSQHTVRGQQHIARSPQHIVCHPQYTAHWQEKPHLCPFYTIKSCESPCWLHLPGAGSFLCQLHNCSELDDWCLVGDARNLWCHLGLNEGLHPTKIFEPVSYYLSPAISICNPPMMMSKSSPLLKLKFCNLS